MRSGVAQTLGALGDAARDALGPLRRHQNDPDPEARRTVDAAIQAIEQGEHFEILTIPADSR
ncbi:MAG: hypothetical protein ACLQGP_29985 [Isosphaeraceae bacterium]